METFAYLESAVAYEDPNPEPQLRTLKELGLTVPSSAWMGLAAILLSASMLVAQVPMAQAFPATVTAGSGVNIRSGPSTAYPRIGGLGYGARVEVVSTSNGWYQLSSGGWIAGNYTSTSGGGGGPSIGTVTVTSPSGVNIRSGPGVGYSRIGGLGYGQSVRVLSLSNGWYQLAQGTGWIAANYTSGTSGGGGGGGGTGVSGTVTVTAGSGVNIRSGPSTAYARIGGLGYGQSVRVVSTSNGWYQLSSGGWIAGNYTSGIGGGGGGGGGGGSSVVTVAASSGLNIRSGPSTAYSVIGSLANGQRVQVSGSSNGFYRLSSGGWISASYVY